MPEGRKKNLKPWLVCIGCAMIYAGLFGGLYNCTGLLFTAIQEEYGFTHSQIAIYHMIKQLACASAIGPLSKLCTGRHSKAAVALTGTLSGTPASFATSMP